MMHVMKPNQRSNPAPAPAALRRPLSAAALVGLLVALSACAECEDDYDCPGARICDRASATCQALVCRVDRDCPPAQTCADNACTPTPATPAPDAPDAVVIGPP